MENLDLSVLDELLHELYTKYECTSQLSSESALLDSSDYEMSLYGYKTTSDSFKTVLETLSKGKKKPSDYHYVINTETNELLVTNQRVNNLNQTRITNDSTGSLSLKVSIENKEEVCDLFELGSSELDSEISTLLSKIRLINWLIYAYCELFSKLPADIPKNEGLITVDNLYAVSTKLGDPTFVQNYYNSNISDIQKCIFKGNVFYLKIR